MNLYTPMVSQSDYQAHESQSVLEKLYGNSLKKVCNFTLSWKEDQLRRSPGSQ